jgi:hypothetical protein
MNRPFLIGRTLTSPDGKRKVEIFEWGNGTFGFEEYFFDAEEKV